jgi:hypothetical protein
MSYATTVVRIVSYEFNVHMIEMAEGLNSSHYIGTRDTRVLMCTTLRLRRCLKALISLFKPPLYVVIKVYKLNPPYEYARCILSLRDVRLSHHNLVMHLMTFY